MNVKKLLILLTVVIGFTHCDSSRFEEVPFDIDQNTNGLIDNYTDQFNLQEINIKGFEDHEDSTFIVIIEVLTDTIPESLDLYKSVQDEVCPAIFYSFSDEYRLIINKVSCHLSYPKPRKFLPNAERTDIMQYRVHNDQLIPAYMRDPRLDE